MPRHVVPFLVMPLWAAGPLHGQTFSSAPPAEVGVSRPQAVLLAPLVTAPQWLPDDGAPLPLGPIVARPSRRATVTGLVIGGGVGVAAGLIVAHTSCNEDPCTDGAYVLAAAGGALVFGGIGALIGSRVSR